MISVNNKLRSAWQKRNKLKPLQRKYEPNVMNQSKQIPIDIIALRANDRTHDGKNIIISLKPRYSPEQTYSVPVECLYELITDLQNLNSSKGTAAIKPLEQSISAPQPAKDLSRINVTIPKKWMLKSGLPDHPIVVVIFNPQTEIQSGYALPAAAAKEMGVGLVKYADIVAGHEASKRTLS